MTFPRRPVRAWTVTVTACAAIVAAYGSACGSGHDRKGGSPSRTAGPLRHELHLRPRVNDAQDGDDRPVSLAYNTESNDDNEVVAFGRAADPRVARVVTETVERFFAAAVADSGSRTCAMMTPSLAREVAYSIGRKPNPPYFKGRTCPEVMSKLLRHERPRLVAEAAGYTVTGVRVGEGKALALLSFRSRPERRYLAMQRSHRARRPCWELAELVDGPYP